jgi:biotin transport system substrate-specific component
MSLTSGYAPGRMTDTPALHAATHAGLLERKGARWALVFGFALLTCAGAKISIPLPLTPVPATLQTLAVLLAGAVLGARRGAASQVAYLLMGMAGLPVFALPGAGPAYLLGPTGGYLIGFVAAGYVVGLLLDTDRRRGVAFSALAFLLGAAMIHACGLAWLSVVLGDPAAALRAGVLPFVLFDLAKVVIATGAYSGYLRWKPGTRL